MVKFVLFFLLLFSSCRPNYSCNGDCDQFESYDKVKSCVRSSRHSYSDKIYTSKSKWVIKAEYYSCDKVKGYFIITLDNGQDYIYKDLPIEMLNEFKSAPSYGSYYVNRIKGKYNF